MVITRTREELYKTLEEFSKRPGKLALIPTMGNLHDGHLSLIKLAKLKASKTITTIFINNDYNFNLDNVFSLLLSLSL